MEVLTIGKCYGCTKMKRLDNNVCKECLGSIGRDVAMIYQRARDEPKVRKILFHKVATEDRPRFIEMFGDVNE